MKQFNPLAISIMLILFCFLSPVWSDGPLERMEIPSSPNPVGSGARALGMGGAFIGLAEDATAASWNPAGIAQLKKSEVSTVFHLTSRTEDNHIYSESYGTHSKTLDDFNVNYFSATFVQKDHDIVFSLSYQHQYDFNREWHMPVQLANNNASGNTIYDMVQEGDLYALGFAVAVRINSKLFAGFTLNDWGHLFKNRWKQSHFQNTSITLGPTEGFAYSKKNETYTIDGLNANLGVIYKINDDFQVGAVIKTPFKATLDLDGSLEIADIFPTFPEANNISDPEIYQPEYHLRMPLSYGLGMAWILPEPGWTFSADIYRTHWNQFEMELDDGRRVSPVSGLEMNISDVDPTIWFRCGVQKDIILSEGNMAFLRGGLFYDPAPAERSPDDFWGFSMGGGFSNKKIAVDAAAQVRFGNDVGSNLLQHLNFSQDVVEYKFFMSFIYYL
jgi:long-subunit fatty acid transport protein